jgi:hypothetical protein
MRLDHVSYVASHDQISDVVNRIGSQIGTAFVDGGIHPKFGTRNFTAPLLNGQYIEIVCPLDHPATDATPFGRAVKNKAQDGGGWLTWVLATDDIEIIEKDFGRKSVLGQRKKPDGSILAWKQVGVLEILDDPQQPFYIEWISGQHPSTDGNPTAKLLDITINIGANADRAALNKVTHKLTEELVIKVLELGNEKLGIETVGFEFKNTTVSIY